MNLSAKYSACLKGELLCPGDKSISQRVLIIGSYLNQEIFISNILSSSDPICTESEGQGLGGFSFAACHACTMIPDLACEQVPKNIFLDRTTIIGSEKNLKGYFS